MRKAFYIFTAILAFTLWGIFPLIYKVVKDLPALEILSFRIFISSFFLIFVAFITGNLKNIFKDLNLKNLFFILCTTILTSINWFIFIKGSITENVINVSLGYFICPIIDICLGVLVLKEKLTIFQKISLVLSCIGIFVYILFYGKIPYIGLSIAFCFALYTLIRKTIKIKPLHGLILETSFLFPISCGYLFCLYSNNDFHFNLFSDLSISFTLILIGCLAPTLMFLYLFSSKKLSLSTLGFLHYIEPTIHFLLGIFILKESFNSIKLISFSFIWLALAVISFGPYIKTFFKK
ncbi:MAG: EamA family transporter RarD [Bacteroidetes bacterium]|nr:EamA family transporter RarD [Bacteroidota bacterium]